MRGPKFSINDVVVLTSGSPEMTIEALIYSEGNLNPNKEFTGSYRCVWFEGTTLIRSVFKEENLNKPAPLGFMGAV